VQADMVKELKRRTARWLLVLLKITVAAAAILVACYAGMRLFAVPDQPTPRYAIDARFPILAFGAAAMLFVLRLMLQRSVDPNLGYPSRRAETFASAGGIPGKADAQMLQQRAPAE
jgi:TRAP-type C4-dicarboxylate transport system permease small subunit